MSEDLKPELRFSLFDDCWQSKKYNEIYSFYTTNSLSRENLNNNSGLVKNIHYGDIHTKFSTLFDVCKEKVPFINDSVNLGKIKDESYCQEGDLVIADASENYADIGKAIEIKNLNNEQVLAGLHTFLARPNKHPMVIGFAGYLMQSGFVRKQIKLIAQGAKVLGISAGRLGSIDLLFPHNDEQQKIADFLTSVDTKISQLTEKYRLLKDYKKGVMQQIFSQQIRFKDDDGNAFPDWNEYSLRDILILQSDALKMDDEATYELITVKRGFGGIKSRGHFKGKDVLVKSQFTIHKGEFVISKRQIVHGACGLVPEELDGAIVSNEYNVFRPQPTKLDIDYFNRLSTTLYMRRAFFINSDGVHIEKLLFKTQSWLKTKVQLPCLKEQQKIAQFLRSLDKKIDAVNQQIEQTKLFKKGLLQQMFV